MQKLINSFVKRVFLLDPTEAFFHNRFFSYWEWELVHGYFYSRSKCSRTNLNFLIYLPQPPKLSSFCLWFSLLCKSLWLCLGPICLFLLLFISVAFGDWSKCWKHGYNLYQRMFCLCSILGVVMVSYFIFKSLYVILSVSLCVVWGSIVTSNLIYVAVQLSQHHLLKRLSFLHRIFLPPFLKIDCRCVGLFLGSLICSIDHMSMFVLMPRCSVTVALQYCLKLGNVMPPVLFFFLRIALAILGLLWFHIHFSIICFTSMRNVMGNFIGISLNL